MNFGDRMKTYIPVARAKANDLAALSRLSDKAKEGLKPLLEPPLTKDEGVVTTDLAATVAAIQQKMPDRPFFFDPLDFEIPSRQTAALDTLTNAGRLFTPVVGLGRRAIDTHFMKSLVAKQRQGLCVRLKYDDLEDASEETWIQLAQLATSIQVSPSDIEILFDFASVNSSSIEGMKNAVLEFLRIQPRQFNCKAFGILASSCLSSVGGIDEDGEKAIERVELELWANLVYELDGTRRLSFGDYGIVHPDFVFSGPNPNSNAKIRYTRGSRITYFRGHGLYNPNRFPQYHDLAQRVVDSGIFLGAKFSFGDDVIQRCAAKERGPGNLGTWVMADMNHHLEFTSKQIPRLLGELFRVTSERQVRDVIHQDI